MRLVEEVARMIDQEGAYSEWCHTDGTPVEPTVRQKYFQAKYECIAIDILKLVLKKSASEIRGELILFEKEGWRRLGVPIDDPRIKDEADRIIAEKFA